MLRCEGAVCGDPVLGVVRLLEGVADAGVAGSKDALARALVTHLGDGGGIELEVHQLVHVAQDKHVRIELNDAVILDEAKGSKLTPAVVEARVIGEVAALGGEEIRDVLRRDAAGTESLVSLGREGVGVEGDEGVARFDGAERVVEGEKTREIVEVRDEGCPD